MTLNTNRFRPWLMLLARTRLPAALQGRVDPSDIVQHTLLQATRDASQYRGTTDAELAGWLRGILGHVLSHEWEAAQAGKRSIDQEIPIAHLLEESARRWEDWVATTQTSPSQAAVRGEEQWALAAALESLSPEHRDVLVLRHLESLSFAEIAERMDRSPGAVRMLWVRALAALRKEVESRGL